MMTWMQAVGKKYADFRSWKTTRKLLTIESDDWGSIRMPSLQAYRSLARRHTGVAKNPYCQYDTLASAEDLSHLYETLVQVRDKNNHPAVLTANVNVANPRFDAIADDEYTAYHYEPFYETIRRQPQGETALDTWQHGMAASLFHPQLHGREHVHALAWLAELRAGNTALLDAFKWGTWGIPYSALTTQRRSNLQASLDIYRLKGEEAFQRAWLSDSVRIFQDYFEYPSVTFIPPAYTWHTHLVPYLAALGIQGVQGISLQYQPRLRGRAGYQKRLRFIGQTLGHGIKCLVRNALFEPTSQPDKDWATITLVGIERAFNNHQPAIISSHRVNYIGSLVEKNRTQNLAMLKSILKTVVKRWPEVEFIGSDYLIQLVNGNE